MYRLHLPALHFIVCPQIGRQTIKFGAQSWPLVTMHWPSVT